MTGYECWFCGKDIDRTDEAAIMLTAQNLWSGKRSDPTQRLHAHSACAAERLAGARMQLDPSDLLI